MIAYAETHRQASHAQCAHCCAPQEEIAARLLAKAWLACLLEQEFHPCSTGITACGSSQTKQQVQSCRSDGSSYSLCVCQAATAAFVMSVITNGLICSLQVEVSHMLHCVSARVHATRCCICLFADRTGANLCLTM